MKIMEEFLVGGRVKRWTLNVIFVGATAILALIIGSRLPAWQNEWKELWRTRDYSMHVAKLPHKLTLYGTTTCPYCAKARDYLKQTGIPFNDQIIDQSKDAEAAFRLLDEKYVPVLVSEKKMIAGFNKEAYAALGRIVYLNENMNGK